MSARIVVGVVVIVRGVPVAVVVDILNLTCPHARFTITPRKPGELPAHSHCSSNNSRSDRSGEFKNPRITR